MSNLVYHRGYILIQNRHTKPKTQNIHLLPSHVCIQLTTLPMIHKWKILIIDEYPIFSVGLHNLIDKHKDFTAISESHVTRELPEILKERKPDAVLLNTLHFPNGGIPEMKKIKCHLKGVPILLITSDEYSDCYMAYLLLGAKGFVLPNESTSELIEILRKVCLGEIHFPAHVMELYEKVISGKNIKEELLNDNHGLTARERSIMQLVSQGFTLREIGEQLFISPRTVEAHKRNIMRKLGLQTTADIIRFSARNSLKE